MWGGRETLRNLKAHEQGGTPQVPRLHHVETNAVDRVINEVKQFHFDLEDGDTTEPLWPAKRLSTINDILAVLKLLARKI